MSSTSQFQFISSALAPPSLKKPTLLSIAHLLFQIPTFKFYRKLQRQTFHARIKINQSKQDFKPNNFVLF